MGKILLKQSLIVGCLGILSACATTREDSLADSDRQFTRGSDCISQLSIRDYTVLDDSNVIVTGPGSRKYLVGLGWPAFGLRSSWQIGFRSSGGQVCPGFSDLVISGAGGASSFEPTERIRITSIRALTPEEHEQILVSFGKKKPADGTLTEQTEPPAEVSGAEVEELD